MGEIKSAFEKAMEKVAKLGEPSPQEIATWKYVPEGEKLAVQYIAGQCDLLAELSKHDEDARRYLAEGTQEVLLRHIDLPRNDVAKKNNRRAMEGIKALKKDKASLENVYSKIRRIFDHYEQQGEQQRRQTYEALKANFQAKVEQTLQQQRGAPASFRVNVENQPQFREEWRKVLIQLDSQYLKVLEEFKQEIRKLP